MHPRPTRPTPPGRGAGGSTLLVGAVLVLLGTACGQEKARISGADGAGGAGGAGGVVGGSGGGGGGGANGTGGRAGTGGGGGASVTDGACNYRVEPTTALCTGINRCPVLASIAIDCPRSARSPSVATRGDSVRAAFTTLGPGGTEERLQVARVGAASDVVARTSDVPAGGAFVTGDPQTRIAARIAAGVQLFAEQSDGTWAPSALIAPPPGAAADTTPLRAAADQAGTVHTLWWGSGALALASSDGSSASVANGRILTMDLTAGGSALARVFFFDGLNLRSWTKAQGVIDVLTLGSAVGSAGMFAAAGGQALGLLLTPSVPGATSLSFLFTAGGGPIAAWQDQRVPLECTGQKTVLNPDICPQEAHTQPGGTALLAYAVVGDAGGSTWLVLVTGVSAQTCRWRSVSGCFETLPCDCRRTLEESYQPSLLLFRAPNFATPVTTLTLPNSVERLEIGADSVGDRLGVLLINPGAYSRDARLLVLELPAP